MSRKKWFSLTGNLAILSGLIAITTVLTHVKPQVSRAFEYLAIALAFVSAIIAKKLPSKKLWNISNSTKVEK